MKEKLKSLNKKFRNWFGSYRGTAAVLLLILLTQVLSGGITQTGVILMGIWIYLVLTLGDLLEGARAGAQAYMVIERAKLAYLLDQVKAKGEDEVEL